MSRTGTYWSDHNGRLNCAHGVLLHGTNCVQCERGDLPDPYAPASFIDAARRGMKKFPEGHGLFDTSQRFASGGFVPKAKPAMGVDTASGPDHHAEVTARVNDDGSFTIEEVKLNDKPQWADWRESVERRTREAINGNDERLAAMQERMSAATRKIAEEIAAEARQGRGWGGPYDTSKRWEHSRGDARPRPEHYSCRSRIHPTWGDGTPLTDDEIDLVNGRYRGAEIITDDSDTRGVNARRVGEHRA